ncbi:CsgG/HfaB family protein [Carboxylicivirga taeanensis]|uniref:CsgG/HfaB family protein n=1 Tax=Carboxylicivirga taeanensis TaxID=1416875 RepID=UPI003F6E20C1
MHILKYLIVLVILIQACSPTVHQPYFTEPARLGPETPFHSELKSLPPPKDKLIAAVYKFRDQTGQYKPTELGSSWSTAVTQGATTILIRTLEESGWFRPLERENLGNLSAERQIITNTLATYEGKRATALSPLLFAGIILEGGIISYESNVRTGGVGVRYFGTGASGQYREDRVTVYLRAVSTKNGEILKTVYSSKSILSQQIDFGVFRYVKFKRLLEAETGVTYNEPSEVAVTEAIEKSVYSLIVEGLQAGLWDTEATVAEKQDLIDAYNKEKEENSQIDHLGREFYNRAGMLSVGIVGGGLFLDSDIESKNGGFKSGLNFNLRVSQVISLELESSFGQMDHRVLPDNQYVSIVPKIKFDMLPKERFTPYVSVGYGWFHKINKVNSADETTFGAFTSSVGINYLLSKHLKLNLAVVNNTFSVDHIEGVKGGAYRDMLWEGNIGISFIFGHKGGKNSLIGKK